MTGGITPALPQTVELGRVLLEAGLSIGVAESLTGGALVAELVKIPGISASLAGGVVAYRTELKHSLLGVDEDLLAERGPVDPDVAAAMALGARTALAAGRGDRLDIGLSTTGVAGPQSQAGRAPGVVYVGISSLFGDKVVELDFSSLVRLDDPAGSRQRVRGATVEAAVHNVLEMLVEH